MLRRLVNQAEITIRIVPKDPLLIKAGYASLDGPDMAPVRTVRNGQSTVYIPGPSLKGVLRSHFERIARTLCPGSVCIPYYDPKRKNCTIPLESEKKSYGCSYLDALDKAKTTAERYRLACAACRLFGSLKFGGRFTIGDAYPIETPTIDYRNHVAIDRFTGGTVSGALFDVAVAVGGSYETSFRLTNFELWQLAAIYLLLLDLKDELIPIGSGRSRGLGHVSAEVTKFEIAYYIPTSKLSGLYDLVSDEERQAYGLHAWSPREPLSLPDKTASVGLRRVVDLTKQWAGYLAPLAESFEDFLRWHTQQFRTPVEA